MVGVSFNDVVLVMCVGVFCEYLDDNDVLLDMLLVVMVLVSLCIDCDLVGGNMVGVVLCNLVIYFDDLVDWLNVIYVLMCGNKNVLL